MTDHSVTQLTSAGTSTTPTGHHISYPLKSLSINGLAPEGDEEDGTIKCFCDYQEDDGNTVLCEKCNTWQHIDCYYGVEAVPEVHECADCSPRAVDARKATERQRKRKELIDAASLKPIKKPTTKSHKRKIKPENGIAINGWSNDKHELAPLRSRASGSPKDQPPPAKRPRTNHRTSQSVHAQQIPNLQPHSSTKRSVSVSQGPPSPTKTPHSSRSDHYRVPPYSVDFLHLYDDDPGEIDLKANLFNDMAITNDLALWSHDIEALQDASGKSPQMVFKRCLDFLDTYSWPELTKHYETDESTEIEGLNPRWTKLVTGSAVEKDCFLGELRGKIGDLRSYVADPTNRWDFLRHPAPFVFFHTDLPIYIDTRREGTICRYMRRSCRPNTKMQTILENGSDYHFCFVADDQLCPGTELTTGWRLDQHITRILDQSQRGEEVSEDSKLYISDWVGKVFADFGGCACDDSQPCPFAKWDPRGSAFNHDHRRASKIHTSIHAMRNHLGNSSNSRSGSEGTKLREVDENDDDGSSSGSAKSKGESRDNTPTKGIFDREPSASEMELSSREKRKLADIEKNFEALEQQKKSQPIKRKKPRTSGGSTVTTPTVANSVSYTSIRTEARYKAYDVQQKRLGYDHSQPQTPGTPLPPPPYRNANHAQPQAHARPHQPYQPSRATSDVSKAMLFKQPKPRPIYVDATTQTKPDPVNDIVNFLPRPDAVPVVYESLNKRLRRLALEESAQLAVMRDQWCRDNPDHAESRKYFAGKGMIYRADDGPSQQKVAGDDIILPNQEEESPLHKTEMIVPNVLDAQAEVPSEPLLKPPDDVDSEGPASTVSTSLAQSSSTAIDQTIPSQAPPTTPLKHSGHRSANLHVDLPPPPLFNSTSVFGTITPSAITPGVTRTPSAINPLMPLSRTPNTYPPLTSSSSTKLPPNAPQPSPVKKKLSLGDYMSRRSSHRADPPPLPKVSEHPESPTHEMSASSVTGVQPSESTKAEMEDANSYGLLEGSAITDTPSPALEKKDIDMVDVVVPPMMSTNPSAGAPVASMLKGDVASSHARTFGSEALDSRRATDFVHDDQKMDIT
ncbi:hypothetical protein MMC25_001865 [Agyrium rufum]|nr:hypothetical protein [Agyrium rufum]